MRNHKLVPTASSSSKNNTKQEEPHLSGAYIRSLVKQLSSSSTARSKDHHYSTMGTKPHGQPQEEEQQAAPQTTPVEPQQQPHKKQVRRRLHTSRPYQERLLNMAEARREIVTALKIHRASMRQAKEQQQQQQQLLQLQQQQEVHHQVVQEQSQTSRVACAPMAMSPCASFSDYLYNSSPFSHLTATSSSSTGSYFSPLLPYHSSTPVVAPVGDALDHLMLPLPTQPLGLNLSFQGFTSSVNVGCVVDDDAKNDSTACSFDPTPLLQPSPASSYSVYSSPSATLAGSNDYMSSSAVTAENSSSLAAAAAAAGEASQLQLHRALDDEEMAAIYSIGEQHDIEWSDTMNLVSSAWWSKLQDSVQGGGIEGTAVAQQAAGGGAVETEDASKQYRQGDCFGDILGHRQGTMGGIGSDVVLAGMHHLGDYYGEDVSWPRMDIREIEGWDAEWFS